MQPHPETEATILAGKYRLIERIGAGGMGSVFRAEHMVLGKLVAVKLVELRGSDPNLAERFLREARVAAAVRHPNVVDIIDFGTTETGQPFMVMELLEGKSLLERMFDEGAPLGTFEIVHVASQVLMGLDAVHRAGIVHRDLKPGNIFLTPDQEGGVFARLLDFGISYSIEPGSDLRRGQFGTDERVVMGTPEYMSVEQAEGRPDVDARADIYAMGVILYELLSRGELPFADPNPGGVLFKVMTGTHRPLGEIRPDIVPLTAVVERALSLDREMRPGTARELRRQLLAAAELTPDISGTHFRLERTSQTDIPAVRLEHPTLEHLPPTKSHWPVVGIGAALVLVTTLAVLVLRPAEPADSVADHAEPRVGLPTGATEPLADVAGDDEPSGPSPRAVEPSPGDPAPSEETDVATSETESSPEAAVEPSAAGRGAAASRRRASATSAGATATELTESEPTASEPTDGEPAPSEPAAPEVSPSGRIARDPGF